MRYLDEIINTKKAYCQYCADHKIPSNTFLFADILFLRYKYGISVADYFSNDLKNHTASRKAFFINNSNTQKKWKYACKKFHPSAGKSWLFWHWFDYVFTRLCCPGLNARDYFMYQMYNQSLSARKSFITDGMLKKINYTLNGGTSEEKIREHQILDNKLEFNNTFSDMLGRKWLYTKTASLQDYLSAFEGMDSVIVKPLDGDSGKGIHKASVNSPEDIKKLFDDTNGKDFLLEEILINHPAIREIHPQSLNTIRVNSVLVNKKVTITGATIRIGVGDHVTDNFGTGGLAAEIDCALGMVYTRAVPWGAGVFYRHPETGKKILGLEIPYWKEIVEKISAAHQRLPEMGYIGWDVAVCPEGKIALIEANTHAGVELQQYPSLKGKKQLYQNLIKELRNQ